MDVPIRKSVKNVHRNKEFPLLSVLQTYENVSFRHL